MNKRHNLLLMLCALLAISAVAQQGNRIYIEDFEIEPGKTVSVPLMLSNQDPTRGMQFNISLPNGLRMIDQELTAYSEEYNMNMCVHPDDPPIEILGLPRIVRTEEDIQWFLDAVPNKHNGLTFCAGSLSAGAYNNVVEMARKFASRTHFVHLRSCHIFPNGDFTEASHLGGRADLIELCRIFEQTNPELPMRVDHGMTFTDQPGGIMDESSHGHNAGYTLLGRMFALGQVQGILATVDRELGIPYKQPGFFD